MIASCFPAPPEECPGRLHGVQKPRAQSDVHLKHYHQQVLNSWCIKKLVRNFRYVVSHNECNKVFLLHILPAQVSPGAAGAARQTLLQGGAAALRPCCAGQWLPKVPRPHRHRQGGHPHHRARGGGPGEQTLYILVSKRF